MVQDLTLSRIENVPWGFRLAGGADFDIPLTVTKVTENSIAEECGLKEGDIIVRINYEPTIDLPHIGAQEMIMSCANTFVLGIRREDEDKANGVTEPINSVLIDAIQYEQHNGDSAHYLERPQSQAFSEMSEITINSCGIDSISSELETPKISEEHIAEMISGESEVLKEHNVIGINFQRIIPKAGLFKSSEVFKQLNEEAIKTKADKDKEVKKWTTFLQKPNRPIPKSKLEREREYQEPYRVRIVKQPKPLCDPNRVVTPPSLTIIAANQAIANDTIGSKSTESEVDSSNIPNNCDLNVEDEENPEDSELPDLEMCDADDVNNAACIDAEKKCDVNSENATNLNVNENQEENVETNEEHEATPQSEITSQSSEVSGLEKQLADVQNQLLALSTLPSTIQATLEAVSRQIAEILPAFKLRASIDITDNTDNDSTLKLTEKYDTEKEADVEEQQGVDNAGNVTEISLKETGDIEVNTKVSETGNLQSDSVNRDGLSEEKQIEDIALTTDEHIEKVKTEKAYKELEEQWIRKREKTQQQQLSMNEKRQLIAQSIARKPLRPNNCTRTPQERPLVLPGGRKWRNAKDAYNEEFIAEIISSQAELISGSTLGKYESPLLGYDDRINFLKYKKPEKDLSNLDRSEVFKLIHSNENARPFNGISIRPEKVVAADDVCRPTVC